MVTNPNLVVNNYKEKFIVKVKHQWVPIYTKDIACFYRDNLNYLITVNGDKHILDFTTLDEVEELLDPKIFYRANRQTIIHIDFIQSIKPQENQKLVLTLKPPLKMELDISREKHRDLRNGLTDDQSFFKLLNSSRRAISHKSFGLVERSLISFRKL